MNILFAWELGHNLGHILRQLQIARALRARGHAIMFAVAGATSAVAALLSAAEFDWVAAPARRLAIRNAARAPASYADTLAAHGFVVPAYLDWMVGEWHQLFLQHRADVVLLDHAPTALLAARIAGVGCMAIGTGFELPPASSPFPLFRPGRQVGTEALLATESVILENANAASRQRGGPAFASLQQCLSASASLLLTFAEFDHYPQRVGGNYLGSLFSMDAGLAAHWPEVPGKKIFVYLQPNPELPTILGALRALDQNTVCVIAGIDAQLRASFESTNFAIHTMPLKLDCLLPQADLVVCHNGHGLLSACALAGVPVLALPLHVEQLLSSLRMEQLGMGKFLGLSAVRGRMASELEALLNDSCWRNASTLVARKYARHDQIAVVHHIGNVIESL